MKNDPNLFTADTEAATIVSSFIDALNNENYDTARDYISDDLSFVGVMGSRNGAEDYINDMRKMKLKYDVKQTFNNGDEVCLWYDITMSGTKILSCGWYKVRDRKIYSFRVLFDPGPLLETSKN